MSSAKIVGAVNIRPETPADIRQIHALHIAAFGAADEATLVDALRTAGDLTQSLVASRDGKILSHIALSRLTAPFPAEALAPVATHPDAQRQGLAASLIQAAIGNSTSDAIFVLGNPAYYTRFGFSLAATEPFACPYAGPHFMALSPKGEMPAPATLSYANAFSDLD